MCQGHLSTLTLQVLHVVFTRRHFGEKEFFLQDKHSTVHVLFSFFKLQEATSTNMQNTLF